MIMAGVHLYVYDLPKKFEYGTLGLDLPFQTLAVDFSSNLD